MSTQRRRPRAHTGDQAAEQAIFAATERLLATESLHALSVQQILTEANLSRASFYHYFSNKYEVVAALMARIFAEIYEATQDRLQADWADPADALRTSLATGLASWNEHRSVMHAVLENQHAVPQMASVWKQVSDPFVQAIAEQVRRERTAGRAPDGLPAETIASICVCAAERIYYAESSGTDPRLQTPDQGLDAIVALSLAAIYGSASGPKP